MQGTSYERDLKQILEGEEATVRSYLQYLKGEDAHTFEQLIDHPFIVVRAAGSFGIDLIAVRSKFSFPIEVKSSANKIIRFSNGSSRMSKQAMNMKERCERAGILPLYAYRLKGKHGVEPWRLFILPTAKLNGIQSIFQSRIPYIKKGIHDNFEMRWEAGLQLSRFIAIVMELDHPLNNK
ncbi:MAG: Holliday junction resolvase [Candidatus Thermoplasmatota archaeon]|nr:Holliday junction resolvase [Candidatus Thermoplasmatota archaeon]MCL5962777.1 Holliday junction resolvase [Candidatus Thermoplasmatota archaeon]